jgi:toxin FitB
MYLLDTNVISELRRPRPHGAVVAWLEGVADHDLHLSAVTLGELQAGVEITREQDPERASQSGRPGGIGTWPNPNRLVLSRQTTFA